MFVVFRPVRRRCLSPSVSAICQSSRLCDLLLLSLYRRPSPLMKSTASSHRRSCRKHPCPTPRRKEVRSGGGVYSTWPKSAANDAQNVVSYRIITVVVCVIIISNQKVFFYFKVDLAGAWNSKSTNLYLNVRSSRCGHRGQSAPVRTHWIGLDIKVMTTTAHNRVKEC